MAAAGRGTGASVARAPRYRAQPSCLKFDSNRPTPAYRPAADPPIFAPERRGFETRSGDQRGPRPERRFPRKRSRIGGGWRHETSRGSGFLATRETGIAGRRSGARAGAGAGGGEVGGRRSDRARPRGPKREGCGDQLAPRGADVAAVALRRRYTFGRGCECRTLTALPHPARGRSGA